MTNSNSNTFALDMSTLELNPETKEEYDDRQFNEACQNINHAKEHSNDSIHSVLNYSETN